MRTLANPRLLDRPLNHDLVLITTVCFGSGQMVLRSAEQRKCPRQHAIFMLGNVDTGLVEIESIIPFNAGLKH